MSGKSAASRSRRPRSSSRIAEACWKSDFEEAENAAASSSRDERFGHRAVAVAPLGAAQQDLPEPGIFLDLAAEIDIDAEAGACISAWYGELGHRRCAFAGEFSRINPPQALQQTRSLVRSRDDAR